jgi:phosphoribosylformimino-5-aminoimidazole carboxamide ribotide isomerase
MLVIPAIDLRGGRAVQWVGGRPETEMVSLPDPVGVASCWAVAGFSTLHMVDLDAALGSGGNGEIVRAVLAAAAVPVQVGGGVRDDAGVAALLALGAARVVVGTRAVRDPEWLALAASRWPGRLVVAADCRDGRVVTHGWVAPTGLDADAFVAGLAALPLAGVLVTDVDREGSRRGVDAALFARFAEAAGPLPLVAAGGIGAAADLEALADVGVAAAVVGMALYTGDVAPADAVAVERRSGGAPAAWRCRDEAGGERRSTDAGSTGPGSASPGSTYPGSTDPGSTDPGSTDPGSTDPDTPNNSPIDTNAASTAPSTTSGDAKEPL